MEYSVCLRDFEERDIDFVLKCKNDDALNEMTVGQSRKFTSEDARKWVEGCIGDHDTYKFWAVCTNDDEKRIVGWVSLSEIDEQNKSACHHGIVIGDNMYRDGVAMFETMLLSMDYAFTTLHAHRLYGSCLSGHKTSPHMLNALGFVHEGTKRDAIFRAGKFYNILEYGILEHEYKSKLANGDYDVNQLIMNFIKSVKKAR